MESQKVSFPLKIEDVEPEHNEELMQYFTGELTGFIRVGQNGYIFPHKFKNIAADIYNMALRSDDIFIVSYPRSGTTWTQELIWIVANDFNYKKSQSIPLTTRFPFLESSMLLHPLFKQKLIDENNYSEVQLELLEQVAEFGPDQVSNLSSPRFIQTHLPLSLLPPTLLDTARVVYVARDPRDVAVSYYYLSRLIRTQGYIGDFKQYWNFFVRDLIKYTPFFDHLKNAWESRHHPNMLFLFYEDSWRDLMGVVRRVANFFGKQISEEQVTRLCDHLSFENFKNNQSVNHDTLKELGISKSGEQGFIRKGVAGGWRNHFDDEMSREAENWIKDNLRETDFCFPHMNQN